MINIVTIFFGFIFGSIFILFVPGFFLSFIFFPRTTTIWRQREDKQKTLDWFERIIISLFLSITIITLVLFVVRRIDIPLTPLLVALIVILINIISIAGAWFIFSKRKKYENITH